MSDSLVTFNPNEYMTHIEFSDTTGKRRDNVKRAMDALNEQGVISLTHFEERYIKEDGKEDKREVYAVNERDSYIVMAQLSPKFTAELVDDWKAKTETLKTAYAGLADIAVTTSDDETAQKAFNILSECRAQLRAFHFDNCKIIKEHKATVGGLSDFQLPSVMNLACKITCGVDATDFKLKHGLAPRDYWESEEDPILLIYDRNLTKIVTMIEAGISLREIKAKLTA